MPEVVTDASLGQSRPMFGLRHRPGRLALALFRMPLRAYHHQKGWLLGHTFLLLTHVGRTSGQPHETVAMVLRYRPESSEVVVCSAWGPETDWVRNIRERPAVRIETGREVFVPEKRFLSVEESFSVLEDCLHQHPWRFRFITWVLGWGDFRNEATVKDFVRTRPFVAFQPTTARGPSAEAMN
jgi:deazaflavin-dependent oxidoreductase (nitroreductase family)